jgi:hypothetical protein
MSEPAIGWISEVVLDGPDGEPVPWRVYRDPVGHLFCLVIR